MIGRGSRILGEKKTFSILDIGNNLSRFGLWTSDVDWQAIFKNPNFYLDSLMSDEEIERRFKYVMPDEVKEMFSKSEDFDFDVKEEYEQVTRSGLKSKAVLEKSVMQHARICSENSDDVFDAHILSRELHDDIEYRIKQYSYCILKSSKNYIKWLEEDYKRQLRVKISQQFN